MDLREHKNAIKRFLAIFLGSCSSLTLLYAENMTEDNPGSSGEMCQVVSGRRLVRPTSTYTAARDALTLALCVPRQVMHDMCN